VALPPLCLGVSAVKNLKNKGKPGENRPEPTKKTMLKPIQVALAITACVLMLGAFLFWVSVAKILDAARLRQPLPTYASTPPGGAFGGRPQGPRIFHF
jgi:hypothetical protein